MRRRTLLQTLGSVIALTPFARLKVFAQASGLSAANLATLRAIAEVALPSSLKSSGRDKAVADFASWVKSYKEGADRGHSYGASTLSSPTGASPAARYPEQFAALDTAARAQGGTTFAALPLDARRTVTEAALNTPQPINRLPARPTGANLVADFMGFFFNSADGFDIAYDAAIARDTCRGLDGSDRAPDKWRPGLSTTVAPGEGGSDPAE